MKTTTLDLLNEELEELKTELQGLENNENIEEYDAMIDEIGIDFEIYAPSYILKEVDPTAYRCGHSDFNDEKITELEQDIKDKEEEIEEEKKDEQA